MPYFTAHRILGYAASPGCPPRLRQLIAWPPSNVMSPPEVYAIPVAWQVNATTGAVKAIRAKVIENWGPTVMSPDIASLFHISRDGQYALRLYDYADQVVHAANFNVVLTNAFGNGVLYLSWKTLSQHFTFQHIGPAKNLVLTALDPSRCRHLTRGRHPTPVPVGP